MEDSKGNSRYAEYSSFSIGSPATNYVLSVGTYTGDAGMWWVFTTGRLMNSADLLCKFNKLYSFEWNIIQKNWIIEKILYVD